MSDFLFDPNQLVWVEKYRPRRIADCILPEATKKVMQSYVSKGDFPSLLLHGGPGQGKTTAAKALCSELDMDVILINVSKDRGIDVLRTQIENFATSVSLDGGVKCIILDEFDGATEMLQRALRAAIEEYSINCRFILTCNYPNKIIDAIHSRTAKIDMRVDKKEIGTLAVQFLKRVEQILKIENVEYDKKAVAKVIQNCFPDFRQTLNTLQQFASIGKIDMDSVNVSTQEISILKLVKALKDKDYMSLRQWCAANGGSDPGILFTKFYNEIADILKPSSIPEVVVVLAGYMHNAPTSLNLVITLEACFAEIMAVGEFK